MNCLSIDYGSKRIGLAYSQDGFIFTLPAINNDSSVFIKLQSVVSQYSINQIFVGQKHKKQSDYGYNYFPEDEEK